MVAALDFQSPSREKVSHAGEITMKRHWGTDELVEHWTLLPRETELLTNKTGATRLGFAVLLKFFQLEAYFPQQASDVNLSAHESGCYWLLGVVSRPVLHPLLPNTALTNSNRCVIALALYRIARP
jgi:hypothetical protein